MTTFSCYDLQMAFSKLTSAKLMKTVGSYDQAEFMEAMDNIEIDQMQQTHKILRALHNNLKLSKLKTFRGKKGNEGTQKAQCARNNSRNGYQNGKSAGEI